MYISRLSFYTRPDQTEDAVRQLRHLGDFVAASGLPRPQLLRMSMASPGASDKPNYRFCTHFIRQNVVGNQRQRLVGRPPIAVIYVNG